MSVESLPSQPLDDPVSSLFVDAGAIFVDPGAGGIIGRPKLLRSLRVTLSAYSTCNCVDCGTEIGGLSLPRSKERQVHSRSSSV